ncbi:MAG: glycosyltransferase family 39 protein [Anaerolineae bacterium]
MNALRRTERALVVLLLLLAWGLRWVALMDVPPGWRDDDLIELYTFSGRVVEEGPVLYFPGASGHEPLYHTLRAPLVALAGINQASARWMSATAGTLAVLLTWAVGRRMLGRGAGLTAGAAVAVSFWSLMYSRVAIRHIGALPWMLLALYGGWRQLRDPRQAPAAPFGIAVGTAGALLTYYAGRLMPFLLVAIYPFAHPRRRRWRGYFGGLAFGVLLAVPMFWAAARLPGADARVGELAVPLHALRAGDPRPFLQTAWTSLGMFHARGDPEWLYNISERPVFGPVGAGLFYLSLAVTLVRWRRPEARVLLLWLAAGISPALISLPPSSYGHTILAQPATYLLLATLVPAAQALPAPGPKRRRLTAIVTGLVIVGTVAMRDLPDYFHRWPNASMVRFLYRADYRALAEHLDAEPEIDDVAVGSMLFGPWDKVALATDYPAADDQRLTGEITGTARQRVAVRWFDPARALVFVEGGPTRAYLQDEGARAAPIQAILQASVPVTAPEGMQGYWIEPIPPPDTALTQTGDGQLAAEQAFAGSLALTAVAWQPSSPEGGPLTVTTWWTVEQPLTLPTQTLIPHPPPPGVYNGPRLSVFAHLWPADASGAAGEARVDDGLWVDPYSIRVGDVIMQVHEFEVGSQGDSPAGFRLHLGFYDPLTGTRWTTPEGKDHLELLLASAAHSE